MDIYHILSFVLIGSSFFFLIFPILHLEKILFFFVRCKLILSSLTSGMTINIIVTSSSVGKAKAKSGFSLIVLVFLILTFVASIQSVCLPLFPKVVVIVMFFLLNGGQKRSLSKKKTFGNLGIIRWGKFCSTTCFSFIYGN